MEFYGGDFDISVYCAGIHISGRAYLGDLQRGIAVLPDRDGIYPACVPRAKRCWRVERTKNPDCERCDGGLLEENGARKRKRDWGGGVRSADGDGVCVGGGLLVQGFSWVRWGEGAELHG